MTALGSFDPDDEASGSSSFADDDGSAWEALADVRRLLRDHESNILARPKRVVWHDRARSVLRVDLPFSATGDGPTKVQIVPGLWEEYHRRQADPPTAPARTAGAEVVSGVPAAIAASVGPRGRVRHHVGPYRSAVVAIHVDHRVHRFVVPTEAAAEHPAAVTCSFPTAAIIVTGGISAAAFAGHSGVVLRATTEHVIIDGVPVGWEHVDVTSIAADTRLSAA